MQKQSMLCGIFNMVHIYVGTSDKRICNWRKVILKRFCSKQFHHSKSYLVCNIQKVLSNKVINREKIYENEK